MPDCCANRFTTAAPPSSTEIPTTANPFLPYLFCRAMKPGISALQGGHQVAQKSKTTTLPLKSEEWTVLPSPPWSSQPGAASLDLLCPNSLAVVETVTTVRTTIPAIPM